MKRATTVVSWLVMCTLCRCIAGRCIVRSVGGQLRSGHCYRDFRPKCSEMSKCLKRSKSKNRMI